MATYSITGPDNKTYSIDGPEGATREQVIAQIQKRQQSAAAPAEQRSGIGDFFKSIPRGVLSGFSAAASAGGQAAAAEMNEPEMVQEIPTAQQGVGIMEKNVTGELPKPQGRAGKYGAAVGETLGNPASYVGPGNLVSKVVTGTTSALGSEAAGQLTEGYPALEPYARVAGAVAGGKVPAGAARMVSPIPSTAERQAAVQVLAQEGIDAQTAGQTTGSKATQYLENFLGDTPGAGGRATASRDEVGRQFTAAALRRAGINNEELATPQVIDGAFQRIGNEMETIAARNNTNQDAQFVQELHAARDEYQATVQQGSRRAVVDHVIDDFTDRLTQSPVITGEQYQRFRSRLTRLQRGAADDPEYSQVLGDYVEAMDGMMARSITNQQDMAAWQEARRQYRNLIPLARASVGAGEQAAEGVITPARLRQVIAGSQRGARDYARGRGDFAELARAGNFVLTPLPNSGTAQREMAHAITAAAGGAVGLLAGGAPEASAALVAGAAAPAVAGRALMSPLAQGYLANQVGAGWPQAVPSPAWRSALTSPLAAGGP
jgi:hypothetical protein